MSTVALNDPTDDLSEAERARWRACSETLFIEQFNDAFGYVCEEPDRGMLAANVHSLLNLLDHAFDAIPTYTLICDMVAQVHPLPLNEGYRSQWEHTLRRAAALAEANGDARRTASLRNVLSSVLYHSGHLTEALDMAHAALIAARETHDTFLIASVGGTLVSTLMNISGRLTEAGQHLQTLWDEPLLGQADDLSRVRALIHLHTLTTLYRRRTETLSAALHEIEQAVQLVTNWTVIDESTRASVHRNRGLIRWLIGDYAGAVADFQYALAAYIELHDATGENLSRGNLALVYWSMGRYDLSEAERLRCIDHSERLYEDLELTHHIGDLALVYLAQGRLSDALACIDRQRTLADQLGWSDEQGRALGNRGVTLVCLGQWTEARRDLLSEQAPRRRNHTLGAANNALNLARCHCALGHPRMARYYIGYVLRCAEQINSPPLRIAALRVLAECVEAAETRWDALNEALDLARDKRPLDEAACLLSLAALSNDPDVQNSMWQRGVRLLDEIGATAWLEGHGVHNPPCILAMA